MDTKFNELKLTFNGIKNLREEINSIFDNLEQRVLKLKDLYKDFLIWPKQKHTRPVLLFRSN